MHINPFLSDSMQPPCHAFFSSVLADLALLYLSAAPRMYPATTGASEPQPHGVSIARLRWFLTIRLSKLEKRR